MWTQVIHTPDVTPLLQWKGLRILPGLTAVTGDEGSGKTHLLRELSAAESDVLWLDPRLPARDEHTPVSVWAALQARCPRWNAKLQEALMQALDLQEHLGKQLFMLSAGSRRKVALVGLLASGATVTCIDQPYAALDLRSVRVIQEFLQDAAGHPSRAWVVADHEADAALDWSSVVTLQVNCPGFQGGRLV